MTIKFPVLLAALAFLLVPTNNAVAGEEPDLSVLNAKGYQATGESKRCVGYSRIRRTEVLDDNTILFHMAGRKTYANILKYECPSLGFQRAIKYTVRGGTLCNIDHVEVITSSNSGPTCRLGSFYEVVELDEESAPAVIPTSQETAQ